MHTGLFITGGYKDEAYDRKLRWIPAAANTRTGFLFKKKKKHIPTNVCICLKSDRNARFVAEANSVLFIHNMYRVVHD